MAHAVDYAVTTEGHLTVYSALDSDNEVIDQVKLFSDIPDLMMLWDHVMDQGHTISDEMMEMS